MDKKLKVIKGVNMRINKYIASCGVASRRKAEELILNKKVKVNGRLIEELSFQVDEYKDTVEVDGVKISLDEETCIYTFK